MTALLASAAVYRVVLVGSGWPVFESDQAIIGLMARHIWLNGEHPLFFYGQYYMGPVEAYSAVPFFAAFGSSIFSLRLAMVPLVLLFLVVVYLLGRVAYGPAVGLLSLAWLVVGPSVAVDRELTTFGGKQEVFVLAGVIMLCAWARLRTADACPQSVRAWLICLGTYAALGAASGLGIWSDWLIAPVVVSTLLVLVIARWRELFPWPVTILVVAFAFAAYPFLQFNLAQQFTSLQQALYFGNPTGASIASRLAQIPSALAGFVTIVLPAIAGSPHVCVRSTSDLQAYPWITSVAQVGGVCTLANALFSIAILSAFAVAVWSVSRSLGTPLIQWFGHQLEGWTAPSPTPEFATGSLAPPNADASPPHTMPDNARLWLRAIMAASVAVWVLAFLTNPADLANPLDKTRYLVPIFIATPLLFGMLWEMLYPAAWLLLGRIQRGEHAGSRSPLKFGATVGAADRQAGKRELLTAVFAGSLVAVLIAFSVLDGFAMAADSHNSSQYALPEPQASAEVLTFFDAHHVRTFYTDSYYTCYRFAFESNERQVCAVLGADGLAAPQIWINRYTPYVSAVASDPHHAYLLPASLTEAKAFLAGKLPGMGYKRVVVGGQAIYYFAGTN